MKGNSSKDKFVVVSSIILIILIIGASLVRVRIGTQMVNMLLLLYAVLIIASLFLLIKNLLSRRKTSRKWIKYFAFLPICVAIVPPLFFILLAAFEPSIDEQCYELRCELRSSELLKNGWKGITTSKRSSIGPIFFEPRQKDDSYIYDFLQIIFKESERKIIIKSDNCNAVFLLDIPEMPKPQPFSKWRTPVKVSTRKNKKIKLELRYKVIKSK